MSTKKMPRLFCVPVLLALVAGLFVCSGRRPTGAGDDVLSIRLSLNRPGVSRAEFSGTPLKAILVFNDTVNINEIDWQLGEGAYLIPSVWEGDSLVVPVYWNKGLPLTIDSLTNIPHDTMYVTARSIASNRVIIDVINRAPIIDSAVVGDTSFFIEDNIYMENVYTHEVDTTVNVMIRIVAHDLDLDELFTAWRAVDDSLALRSKTINDFVRVYETPLTNFNDTVFVNVEDGNGGKAAVKIVLNRRSGISAVFLDSVLVGDSLFHGDSAVARLEVVSLDTLVMKAYATARTPRYVFGCLFGETDSLGEATGVYRCTSSTCVDTLTTDTLFAIDTITVGVTNASLDTAALKIALIKRPLNSRPAIDSIHVDGAAYDTIVRVQGNTSILLKAFARDPDPGTGLVYEWTTTTPGRIQSQVENRAVYVTAANPYVDTVVCTVSDEYGFFDTDTVILAINLPPLLDSLILGSTSFTAPVPSEFSYTATVQDTLRITTYARDPEGTAVAVTWESTKPLLVTTVDQSIHRYSSLNQMYVDTLTGTFTDADGYEKIQKVILNVTNHRPTIDSLTANGERFLYVMQDWTTEMSVVQTRALTVYASDRDGNLGERQWRLNDGALGTLNAVDPLLTQAEYVSIDSLYTDTVYVRAVDTRGAFGERALAISVNNRPPVVDSLRVDTVTFEVRSALDTMFTHVAAAPDTLTMRAFARDPDNTGVTITWIHQTVQLTGTTFTLAGDDQAYVDTVAVKVEDATTSVTKKIRLVFTK